MIQTDLIPELLKRTLTIACTAQEYQTILTQTDPRMRVQLILSGLGLLDVVSMARESKGKEERLRIVPQHQTTFRNSS